VIGDEESASRICECTRTRTLESLGRPVTTVRANERSPVNPRRTHESSLIMAGRRGHDVYDAVCGVPVPEGRTLGGTVDGSDGAVFSV